MKNVAFLNASIKPGSLNTLQFLDGNVFLEHNVSEQGREKTKFVYFS